MDAVEPTEEPAPYTAIPVDRREVAESQGQTSTAADRIRDLALTVETLKAELVTRDERGRRAVEDAKDAQLRAAQVAEEAGWEYEQTLEALHAKRAELSRACEELAGGEL